MTEVPAGHHRQTVHQQKSRGNKHPLITDERIPVPEVNTLNPHCGGNKKQYYLGITSPQGFSLELKDM